MGGVGEEDTVPLDTVHLLTCNDVRGLSSRDVLVPSTQG